MDITTSTVLATVSFAMLLVVTGGIIYLTGIEWRDRRRRDAEKREAKRR